MRNEDMQCESFLADNDSCNLVMNHEQGQNQDLYLFFGVGIKIIFLREQNLIYWVSVLKYFIDIIDGYFLILVYNMGLPLVLR